MLTTSRGKPVTSTLALFLLLFFYGAQAIADGAQDFKQGMVASRSGDYAQALEAFLRARDKGFEGSTLHYNLGVSYYRLQRYIEAHQAFQQAAENPTMRSLANYNLGLVSFKQQDTASARRWFQTVVNETEDENLRALANRSLTRLDRLTKPAQPSKRWSAFLDLDVGYTDNVELIGDDDILGTSGQESPFIEGFGNVQYRLSDSAVDGWRLIAGTFLLHYTDGDVDEFDLYQVNSGLGWDKSFGLWRTSWTGTYERLWLGGDEYLQTGNFALSARRNLTKNHGLRFRVRFTGLDDLDRQFEELAGWRYTMGVESDSRFGAARLRVGYTAELNDRDDLRVGSSFTSFSPTRHLVRLIGSLPLGADWTGKLELSYRHSRYNDENVFADGRQERRKDDRFRILVRADRPIYGPWHLSATYQYTNNGSALDRFSYTQNQVMVGVYSLF